MDGPTVAVAVAHVDGLAAVPERCFRTTARWRTDTTSARLPGLKPEGRFSKARGPAFQRCHLTLRQSVPGRTASFIRHQCAAASHRSRQFNGRARQALPCRLQFDTPAATPSPARHRSPSPVPAARPPPHARPCTSPVLRVSCPPPPGIPSHRLWRPRSRCVDEPSAEAGDGSRGLGRHIGARPQYAPLLDHRRANPLRRSRTGTMAARC